MKKAPATGQVLGGMKMHNSNYPSKQERIIYKVISVLMDEICLFGRSITVAIIICVCFENSWILPQKHCGNSDFMIVLFLIFCFMQCAILINIFSKKYTYNAKCHHDGEIIYSEYSTGCTKTGGNDDD